MGENCTNTGEHKCSKSKDIDQMNERMLNLQRVVYGNGKKGLTANVDSLATNVELLKKSVEDMQADVKVLLRFQVQTETAGAVLAGEKEERNTNRRWLIGLVLTSGLTLISFIILAVIFIMNIKGSIPLE